MKFKIICEIDEEGRYIIECPDLPGCLTEGETLEEALNNINEATPAANSSSARLKRETAAPSSSPSAANNVAAS